MVLACSGLRSSFLAVSQRLSAQAPVYGQRFVLANALLRRSPAQPAVRWYSKRPLRNRAKKPETEDPHHNREFFEQKHEAKSSFQRSQRNHNGQGQPEPGGPQQFSWRDLIIPGGLLMFFTLLPDSDSSGNGVVKDITWQVSCCDGLLATPVPITLCPLCSGVLLQDACPGRGRQASCV